LQQAPFDGVGPVAPVLPVDSRGSNTSAHWDAILHTLGSENATPYRLSSSLFMLISEAKYTLLCFWKASVQPKVGKPLRDTLAMIKMLTGSYEPCDNIHKKSW